MGWPAGTYYVKVSTSPGSLARYDLVFQVPAAATPRCRRSRTLPNGSKTTAIDLGAYSIFPLVVGTSIAASAEEWYEFNLQRDGIAERRHPAERLGRPADPVRRMRTASQSARRSPPRRTRRHDLSLNGMAAGTYFLKVFGAGAPLTYELKPGDRATERSIVESQTADGSGAPGDPHGSAAVRLADRSFGQADELPRPVRARRRTPSTCCG